MKRSILRGLSLVLVIGAVGCGDEALPGGDDDDDDGATIDDATAQEAGGRLAASAESGARAYRICNSGFVCAAVTSGGDSDGDGIPDYAASEYTACSVQSPWGAAMLDGDEVITDNEPIAAGYDYSLAQDFTYVLAGTGGSVSFEAAQVASMAGGAYSLDEATQILFTIGASTEEEEIAWSKFYTPGSAWSPGDPLVAGSYEVGGAWQVTLDGPDGSSVIAAAVSTVSPLQLDPACATLVVGGSIDAVIDDNGNTQILQVTWTGCDANNTDLLDNP